MSNKANFDQRRMLLIVDPQYDFINGSLPVPNAEESMNALAEYLRPASVSYVCKVVTLDWHPYFHSSFKECDGIWPRHCVQYTHGASIYQPLIDPLYQSFGITHILTKGNKEEFEEYSIFQNSDSAAKLKELIEKFAVDHIDICGLAGDVCVLNTFLDAVKLVGPKKVNVLTEFSPSLDGGTKLKETLENIK